MKRRLDLLIVERGLAESREKAQSLIMAGDVLVDGQVVTRSAAPTAVDADLEIRGTLPYVSRGGVKLAHALDVFGLDVHGLIAADIGASTGGFTDCLLQRGVARVYAIDVGYGQLDYRLRTDSRVVVMERVNVRYLEALLERVDLSTIDVSFISLTKVLPAVLRVLQPTAQVVALVKPQFEAGREQVSKGGVVREPTVHKAVLWKIVEFARSLGFVVRGVTASPLRGPAGNREFLVWLSMTGEGIDVGPAIDEVVAT
ncbi:MAG: TlyA family RNA methyltransferase [Chloroflexota bacterium]|nr:MAG: TlyA family RNA methyltransferase [Chloroflexota bacterium]